MRRRSPPQKIAPTESDVWQATTNEICARAGARWLKETLNTARPINSMNLVEMKCLAEAIISAFIGELSKRKSQASSENERERIGNLLA